MYQTIEEMRGQLTFAMMKLDLDWEERFSECEPVIQEYAHAVDRTKMSGVINTPGGSVFLEIGIGHRVQGPIVVHTSIRSSDGIWLEDFKRHIRVQRADMLWQDIIMCVAEHILCALECVTPGSIFDRRYRK